MWEAGGGEEGGWAERREGGNREMQKHSHTLKSMLALASQSS